MEINQQEKNNAENSEIEKDKKKKRPTLTFYQPPGSRQASSKLNKSEVKSNNPQSVNNKESVTEKKENVSKKEQPPHESIVVSEKSSVSNQSRKSYKNSRVNKDEPKKEATNILSHETPSVNVEKTLHVPKEPAHDNQKHEVQGNVSLQKVS